MTRVWKVNVCALGAACLALVGGAAAQSEAPTGFDNLTNGFVSQAQFDLDRATFDEPRDVNNGLGPLYNARSCAECHQNPTSGTISQVTELHVGHFTGTTFVPHPGGTEITDRAIDPLIQERVLGGNEVRTLRTSLNAAGDGFVEAIADSTLIGLAAAQPEAMRGLVIEVPVGEAGGALRVGRFGWKNMHASLVTFAADAYLMEMGITSPILPVENTSNGNSVAAFDTVPDPEEAATPEAPFGAAIEAAARFMRALKAPPRDAALAATPAAQNGERLFARSGCATCHTPTITTAPAGTVVNGGTFTIPPALGDKVIHPYSDFLLHDVGTGDGIVQNGGPATRNRMRTPPLWGVRTRTRLLHDGSALTRHDAIMRHGGQASSAAQNYLSLRPSQRDDLIAFLNSL